MTIGDRLRTLREHAKIGQAEVAAALDVSIPTVSEWESGKKKPARERISVLAQLFGVTSDYILDGIEIALPDRGALEEEKSLLLLYRSTDEQVRRAVMTLLRAAAAQQ